MTSPTFREQLERRNWLLHLRAVWEEVDSHLMLFIDTDSSKAKLGISTSGDGMVAPQEAVSEVRAMVVGDIIKKLNADIEAIDNKKVAENDKAVKQTHAKKKKAQGAKGRGKSEKRSGKGGTGS